MLTTTTAPMPEEHIVAACFATIGKLFLGRGPEAMGHYNWLWNDFLALQQPAIEQPAVQPTGNAQRRRQRGHAAGTTQPRVRGQRTPRQRTAAAAKTTTTTQPSAPPGTVGEKAGKVLAHIIASGSINAEGLQKAFARTPGLDEPQRIGVAVGNLLGKGYISGTPKTGPFVATEVGVAVMRMRPASASEARARRTRARTTPAAAATEPAAAAGAAA